MGRVGVARVISGVLVLLGLSAGLVRAEGVLIALDFRFAENGQALQTRTFDDPSVLRSSYYGGDGFPDRNGVLTFLIGQATADEFVPGDVVIRESENGPVSDVIQFQLGGSSVDASYADYYVARFYSDNSDSGHSLADLKGLPNKYQSWTPESWPGTALVAETGPENGRYAVYRPAEGQPGYISAYAGIDFTYTFTDAVPLPAAAWAGMLLLGGLGGWRCLRRRDAAVE